MISQAVRNILLRGLSNVQDRHGDIPKLYYTSAHFIAARCNNYWTLVQSERAYLIQIRIKGFIVCSNITYKANLSGLKQQQLPHQRICNSHLSVKCLLFQLEV